MTRIISKNLFPDEIGHRYIFIDMLIWLLEVLEEGFENFSRVFSSVVPIFSCIHICDLS